MKVRDTAMGPWFRCLTPEDAALYVAHCLATNASPDNVFWAIVERYDLKAATPRELGAAVVERLMDFDLDEMNSKREEP